MNYIRGKNYLLTHTETIKLPFTLPEFSIADGLVSSWSHALLIIGKGWTWDGASFFLFRWFWTPKRWVKPSLIHDALYEAIRRGVIGREMRERIDLFFRDELIRRGVNKVEAQLAYWCIRVGGNFALRKDVIEREAV